MALYRVTYPLITTDNYQDFATREEAETFANKKRNSHGHYQTKHSWRMVRVDEVEEDDNVV